MGKVPATSIRGLSLQVMVFRHINQGRFSHLSKTALTSNGLGISATGPAGVVAVTADSGMRQRLPLPTCFEPGNSPRAHIEITVGELTLRISATSLGFKYFIVQLRNENNWSVPEAGSWRFSAKAQTTDE